MKLGKKERMNLHHFFREFRVFRGKKNIYRQDK